MSGSHLSFTMTEVMIKSNALVKYYRDRSAFLEIQTLKVTLEMNQKRSLLRGSIFLI